VDGSPGVASSSLWNNAPRFHSGLAGDEFPAILQRGETVIPKGKADTPTPKIEEQHVHVHLTVNALDSRSVSQAIGQHSRQIVGIVQQGFNRAGRKVAMA
jgi:hypothetical protein